MPKESVHHLSRKAMRVLASVRRIELLEALMSEQPATVEDLGRHLGCEPRALYHHLRPLLRAGIIEKAGERPTSKRPATLYRLPADRLELDPEDGSAEARATRAKIARSILRAALRLQEEAFQNPATKLGGRGREVVLGHRVARLTPGGRKRIDSKLRELHQLLGELHDERGTPYAVTLSLAPVRNRED